jgi:hypothetical protein
MPKPTPMLSRGGDVHPAGMEVSPNFTPTPSGLMNDSNSIHRDFFQTLFQDTPKETALNNVRDWTGNRKAGNTMLLSKAAEKHDQGMLGQYMSEFYGPSGATESTMPLFIDKYKQTLRRKGHDSIMYHNTGEAPGNLDPRTFIMIEPNNIISPFDFEKLRRMGGR